MSCSFVVVAVVVLLLLCNLHDLQMLLLLLLPPLLLLLLAPFVYYLRPVRTTDLGLNSLRVPQKTEKIPQLIELNSRCDNTGLNQGCNAAVIGSAEKKAQGV